MFKVILIGLIKSQNSNSMTELYEIYINFRKTIISLNYINCNLFFFQFEEVIINFRDFVFEFINYKIIIIFYYKYEKLF